MLTATAAGRVPRKQSMVTGLHVEFTVSKYGFMLNAPEQFITDIDGDILVEDVEIGGMSLQSIDLGGASDAGHGRGLMLDLTAEGDEFGYKIFDENGDVRPAIQKAWPHSSGYVHRVLILERMIIDKGHRGYDIGLVACTMAIRAFGYDSFVITKPFPLQYEHEGRDGDCGFPTDKALFQSSKKKLEKHWGRIGFRKIAGSGGYYCIDHETRNLKMEAFIQSLDRQVAA